MKSNLKFLLLFGICVSLTWSCNKYKITFSQVLSIVGTYKTELLECGDEFEQMPIFNASLDTIQSYAELPYERRATITYIDKTVAESLNNSSYGFSDISSNSKGLLIDVCWICLDKIDASGNKVILALDSIYQEIKMPIIMEVTKVKDARTGLEMPSSLKTPLSVKVLTQIDSMQTITYEFSSLTGFYYNAALQLEYELKITEPSGAATTIKNTLTGIKN